MTVSTPREDESVWEVPDSLRLELLARLSASPDHKPHMSFEEFLEWAGEDTIAEWVDGGVEMASPASELHQNVTGFLYSFLDLYVTVHKLGTVIVAPFVMKLPASGREPDVLYVAKENLARVTETFLDGPADAAFEIVSADSERRDRAEKFYEYREGGVPEYWIVDPGRRRMELYSLDSRRNYIPVGSDASGAYRSMVVPGFWLRAEWLWRSPLPAPLAALFSIDPEGARAHLRDTEGGIC
jgi:Uma2 family endonuclease